MKEIEVKILNINPEEIVTKLKELGAKKIEQGLIHAKAYDYPDDRLVKKGQYVRVRKIANRIEVVFKDPIFQEGVKVNEETEFTVDDFDAVCKVFMKLGLKLFANMEKYRATYKLGDVKIEFDKYAGIPWFFEVEASSVNEVKNMVTKLGFDMNDPKKVTDKIIKEVYGDHIHFVSFKEKGESPDYDNLFE